MASQAMNTEWYQKFYQVRDSIFEESTEAALRAREFYREMVGADGIVRLTVTLRLRLTDGGQDWAIEIADAQRVSEFLDWYETRPLDSEERYWLLELIIASLDDRLRIDGPDETLTARVRRHLVEAFEEHRHSVEYWANPDDPATVRFAVTPLMRDVWHQCHVRRTD